MERDISKEFKISMELHRSIEKYLVDEYYHTISTTSKCSICESKTRMACEDTIANVTGASVDVCDVCGLTEEWVSGFSHTFFEGNLIPEDYSMNQVLQGLLRKLIRFGMKLEKEEEVLIDLLLGKETMNKEELMNLQARVAEINLNVIVKN